MQNNFDRLNQYCRFKTWAGYGPLLCDCENASMKDYISNILIKRRLAGV